MHAIQASIGDMALTNLSAAHQQRLLEEEDGADAMGPGLLALVTIFFLIWNTGVGGWVVRAILNAYNGDYAELMIFLCPHWIIGIIIPVYFWAMSLGVAGIIIGCAIPVGIPYSVWIVSCCCLGNEGTNHANTPTNANIVDNMNSNRFTIDSSNTNGNRNDGGSPLHDPLGDHVEPMHGNILETITGQENQVSTTGDTDVELGELPLSLFRRRNRNEDDILQKLIVKKVVSNPPFPWTLATAFTSSFRATHPKTDIVASGEPLPSSPSSSSPSPKSLDGTTSRKTKKCRCKKVHDGDEDCMPSTSETEGSEISVSDAAPQENVGEDHISRNPSEHVCSICLEGYQVGESIAWSKNPKCRHVFHTDCIVSWLQKGHSACPMCRSTY